MSTTNDSFDPQQPCPACGTPMNGIGWRNEPHECGNSGSCPHSEHWIGPWGDCPNQCFTQQVAEAVQERIADELLIISDSYMDIYKHGVPMDIWTWTAELSKRVRAGELTAPLPTDPPF